MSALPCHDLTLNVTSCHILPNAERENGIAQPKAGKCPSSISHFSSFNCSSSIVLWLDKGDYPQNLHVAFCPNKWWSSEFFTCLDLIFKHNDKIKYKSIQLVLLDVG